MPSPVGHIIAGAAIGWIAESIRDRPGGSGPADGGRRRAAAITPLVAVCAAFAVAPDLDILLASHRTYTHSAGAALAAVAVAAAVSKRRGRAGVLTGLACGAAVASHVLLDWLGRDTSTPAGLMALWPFSRAYLISGIDVFAEISRRYWKPDEFILKNAMSVAREVLILAPLAALAWWARRRSRVSRDAHPGSQDPGLHPTRNPGER